METSNKIGPNIQLNNNFSMPLVGLGTYAQQDLDKLIYTAIKDGLRLIDTARIYDNEKEVGLGIQKALQEGVVKREDLFVVTKLWVDDKHQPEVAIKRSLANLNLDYVDLYLDHWPVSIYEKDGKRMASPLHLLWPQMENLVKKGLTKSIGVSNYNVQLLMDLLTYCEIKPVVNQVEYHPYLYQKNLKKFCDDYGIYLMAYNSLTRGAYVNSSFNKDLDLVKEPLIVETAQKYGKTPGQICLNWALVQNVVVIPATSKVSRISENLGALSFKLSDEDFEKLNSLNINYRFNPSSRWPFSLGYDVSA
jgi:diketogulonate reductase-like aldo/keto reductase